MPRLIESPTIVQAAGTPPKRIEEYTGRVNSGHSAVSVARMVSPPGWKEPGQRPQFEEITVVLKGTVRVEHENGVIDVSHNSIVCQTTDTSVAITEKHGVTEPPSVDEANVKVTHTP